MDLRVKEYFTQLDGPTLDWFVRDTGVLDEREELASAVRIALGTDALADADEILPDPDSTDRRGWWADFEAEEIWGAWPIGCKNWLLSRAKIMAATSSEGSTLGRAEQYTLAALQPFVDQHIASRVEVFAERRDLQTIVVSAIIYRGPLQEIDLRFQIMWEEDEAVDVPVSHAVNKLIRVPYRDLRLTSTPPWFKKIIPAGSVSLSSSKPIISNPSVQTFFRLHLDTDFSDSSGRSTSVSGNGAAAISSTQKKFGAGSCLFNGANTTYLSVANAPWQIPEGDFTIDFWTYLTDVNTESDLISHGIGFSPYLLVISNGWLIVGLSSAGLVWDITDIVVSPITANTWHHVALVRAGLVYSIYLDGILGASVSSSLSLFQNNDPLTIGARPTGGFGTNGYIDEFRFSSTALWTSNFIPPTAPS